MINAKTACVLARYKHWADERLFEGVAQLPPTEVVKPRQTLFRSIISTLNHNYLVDLIWKANLMQKRQGFTSHDTVLHSDLGKLRQAQQRENDWFVQWAERQTETTLAEVLAFSFVSGQQFAMSRGAMFMHIVNHSSYHRGWICEMFSEIPAKFPVSDLPFFFEMYPLLDA
ncbi:putative damage-inducible protein DinB [Paraburkholderia sp. BL18I3N2]|uniref:DinB family protein n=1 Tax=Paraburkholderia sp. BL18I3N2 TaxID=1938799 RepID=UPI000D06236C|nr:DinB family protein [Paraburkholderia sp. BL18I3N2]PRX24134.1 putative damage-inducible protein DinB [Paraburkholderia sp. BL18I3N2]